MRFFFSSGATLVSYVCSYIYVVIVEKTKIKKILFIFNSEGSPWKFSCSFFYYYISIRYFTKKHIKNEFLFSNKNVK